MSQASQGGESLTGRRHFQGGRLQPYQEQGLTHCDRSECGLVEQEGEAKQQEQEQEQEGEAKQDQLRQSRVPPSSSRTLSSSPTMSVGLEKIIVELFLLLS